MRKIDCVNCSTSYYTAATYHPMPCPACHDSARLRELARRVFLRTFLNTACAVRGTGVCVPASTVDFSDSGIGVMGGEGWPFDNDEVVDVSVEGLKIDKKARVVWTSRHEGVTRAGLHFC